MAEDSESKYFDLQVVHDSFSRSLLDDDDIDISAYLEAYNELNKFFQLMGSVFSFVSADLKQKIEIMECRCREDEENYVTLKKMIEYEQEKQLLDNKAFVNGARTVLRLHRGLDFIRAFMKALSELDDTEHTTKCCQEAYRATLCKHHTWLVQKAAMCAMYTMPTKETLFKRVCGDEVERNVDILPKMLKVTADVIDRTQLMYKKYDLLELP